MKNMVEDLIYKEEAKLEWERILNTGSAAAIEADQPSARFSL